MNKASMIGLTGALIAGLAYLPQIIHLIKEQCSAGISQRAFAMWLVSSLLITYNAVYIKSVVFIVLGFIQIIATAIILYFQLNTKPKRVSSTPNIALKIF